MKELVVCWLWLALALGLWRPARKVWAPGTSREHQLVIAAFAAPVALWIGLWAMDGLDFAWTRASILGWSAAVVLAGQLFFRGPAPRGEALPGLAGALPSIAAIPLFGVLTARLWTIHSDFVFHWGLKGRKFFLEAGIDTDFLSRPWNFYTHPDYPNLLPALFATGATLTGRFSMVEATLASLPSFWLLVLSARELLHRLDVRGLSAHAGLLAVAWGGLAFAVGFRQAGGADLHMAAAVAAAAVLLISTPRPALDWQVAIVAAFAACSKIEGVVFAVLLIALHAGRRAAAERPWWRAGTTAALRAGAVPGLLVVAWWWQVSSLGLFQATNSGSLDLGRLAVVLPELARALSVRPFYGLAWGLALLPVLLLWPRTRVAALLISALGGFYVYVYLSAPVDTRLYVQTSASRLAFHLTPTVIALLVARLDAWARAGEADASSEGSAPVRPETATHVPG